jgi:hypothetical protein
MIIHLQQRSWSKGFAPFWIWASMVKYLCTGIVAWCRINYARTLFDQESKRDVGVGAPARLQNRRESSRTIFKRHELEAVREFHQKLRNP